ncbi:hypothetical protein ONZ43_g2076 [Nemania bipapillata]|uniref:Uncharacterized protein n=1 Tax=Nemania bipapillata TaxID=110536 RepID=A0ACC2J231_9PEZI|nr:hypothetical protein ONZ43_g2076 [Nemania bipapillata]
MTTHVKFTVTHYRRPEHTHESFMKWLVEEHIPLAIPVFKRHGVIDYSLFVTPADLNAALKANMGGHRAAWDVADFDCFIEYTLEKVENIAEILSDPDWAKSIEHQDDWVDSSKALMSVGYITSYLQQSGAAVNVPSM